MISKGDQALLQASFEGVPFVGAPSGSVTSLLSSTVALSFCTVQLDVWSRRVRESNIRGMMECSGSVPCCLGVSDVCAGIS